MDASTLNATVERRKQVRLRVRPDLQITPQRYEGRLCHVVKDPVCLRYYRFNQQEYFVFKLFDGKHTMEEVRKQFENEFKPHRLTQEDLEGFARQLVTAGLVQHEQSGAGNHLFKRRAKQRRTRRIATLTNILYIKIPVFDPDRLLTWMIQYLWWIFTPLFFAASVGLMLSAVALVVLHYQAFYDKLPAYQEFFAFRTVLYLWISLGIVKVIHEFGHGLSCKAYGGESHEMGFLLMCLSPALYCNVTDAWTVADKWKRIIISFAGIYVELVIAAIATWVWWYTPHLPFVNNLAMCLMFLCSLSTVVFNANPLMRFDGYYMMADWLEIPNLRDRANRYLTNLFMEHGLGIEVPPEQYMAPGRKVLFVVYAVTSYVYRWVVTFSIIWMLSDFLGPKLKILSQMLAIASLASMFIWPVFRMFKYLKQRGRLPDMKPRRVAITATIFAGLLAAFFFLPLPVSRVHESGLVVVHPDHVKAVHLTDSGLLQHLLVTDGQQVRDGQELARFVNPKMEDELTDLLTKAQIAKAKAAATEAALAQVVNLDPTNQLQGELQNDKNEAAGEEMQYQKQADALRQQLNRLQVLKAPTAGYVMSPPRKDEVGKLFEKGGPDTKPFLSVGDPKYLRVQLPVTPVEYRLLKDELQAAGELPVTVHVPGRMDRTWTGKVKALPETDAKTVPLQLTHRAGGSLAVKPSENPNELTPLAQTYIVNVELLDPDHTITPGVLAQAKVHCQWRSAAWWVWRKLAEALDVGLI